MTGEHGAWVGPELRRTLPRLQGVQHVSSGLRFGIFRIHFASYEKRDLALLPEFFTLQRPSWRVDCTFRE